MPRDPWNVFFHAINADAAEKKELRRILRIYLEEFAAAVHRKTVQLHIQLALRAYLSLHRNQAKGKTQRFRLDLLAFNNASSNLIDHVTNLDRTADLDVGGTDNRLKLLQKLWMQFAPAFEAERTALDEENARKRRRNGFPLKPNAGAALDPKDVPRNT